MRKKIRIGKKLLSLLLAVVMFFTVQGASVCAETEGAGSSENPVHHCTKKNDGSDYTDWSYVYFGSYPQTEVKGAALTVAITGADYDADGDAWVNGIKYRRISKIDTEYDYFFGESEYRYFKWEPIKWRVLRNDGTTLFVMADQGIDCKDYHEQYNSITWEGCTLRNWLNDIFYNAAFSSSEQEMVVQQDVVNENHPEYGTPGGNGTKDKIYLLSSSEALNPENGFCEDSDTYSASRRMQPSDYAHAMGVGTRNDITGGNDNCNWLLRSPGMYTNTVMYVDGGGDLGDCGRTHYDYDAVVPVLHIKISMGEMPQLDEKKTISDSDVSLSQTIYTFDGTTKKPEVSVKDGDKTLIKGTDYDVAYIDNVRAGTAIVRITGVGNYTGTISRTFTISAKPINEAAVTLEKTSYTYDGTEKQPSVTVKEGSITLISGTDYTVSYSNNVNVGTATVTITGKGNYAGTATKTFTINAPIADEKQIADCEITLSAADYIYDGSEKRPAVTVKDDLVTLSSGINYSLTYTNNINAGTATVRITGAGNYTGTISKNFTISAKPINEATVTLEKTSYTYDGTVKQPSVVVKDDSTTLINGTHYIVSYSDNVNVGTATVTVTGKGNYAGTATKTFTITAKIVEKKSFVWGKNNWKFDNNSRYFSNYDVNNDVKIKMKNDFNLSNSEIEELEWRIAENNESGFRGSCFGMTVSEIMAYQGGLKLSRYGGSDIVNQNANTSNMTSVINFIQVLQSNSEMCQSIRQMPFLSGEFPQAEFINKLSDVAENSNYLVKLSYKIVTKNTNSGSMSNGYHAVLAYGIEKCNYYSPVTGKTYDRKILIADPNYLSGNAVNNQACLYFKSSDRSWIVPYWNKTYSNGIVENCYWNAESGISTNNGGIRNIMRYESLKEEVDLMSEFSAGHYIAGLEIDNKSQNVSSVEKVRNSGNPNADYTGDFSDEIVRYDMDMDDNIYMTENDELYALWNPTSSYTLSYLKPSDYNLKMDYETVDYYADVTNSTYTLFKPSGSITLKGSDADYDIAMVTEDTDCVTDWYSVAVSGTDVDNLVYTKVKDGYTLSASNLRNVKISAKGEDFTADATISTNYDDVFIYEIDQNTIGVKVDADKNGTYETQIPTEETHQYGSEWKTDEKGHWKECECGEKSELSAHKFKWIIDKNASVHESGFKHEECVVCGYRQNENTVIGKQGNTPAKGQKLTDHKSGAAYKVVIAKMKGGTVEYTKPLNNTVNISIPSTVKIDGISYKVTSIAANAFKNNKKIAKVKIGSNVTSIGKNAFSGCSKLKTLTIGNNVVSIGDNAFLNCTSLKTVTISAKVKKIGKQAFCGCKKLKTIKVSTKKLVSKNVGSKAFARIDPKAAVKVPASCLKSYKKLFQKKGLNGKKQTIKK